MEYEKQERDFFNKILKEKNKIKEEMRTMAKLAIKDGKLQPVSDEEVKKMVMDAPEPSGSPFGEMQMPPQMPQMQQQQQYRQPQPQPQPRPQPQPQRMPPQFQQPPELPPQEFEQPIQPAVQPQSETGKYVVQIVLTDRSAMNVEIDQQHINDFLENISEAIRDQSPFQVGNRIINGRYIMYFTL